MDVMNIYLLVQEFYAIEALSALVIANEENTFEPLRPSHERWKQDFDSFRDNFTKQLAASIFDYTVLAVAGELRHCKERASQYIGGYYSDDTTRDGVFENCTVYRPKDILYSGLRMFNPDKVIWHPKYGGVKWQQIAKAGLMKGRVSDCVFVDHCVDLSHNCCPYFDKGAKIFILWNSEQYAQFLDFKRICASAALLEQKQGQEFNRLLSRANTLQIVAVAPKIPAYSDLELVRADWENRQRSENTLLSYQPVEWGDEPLDYSEKNIIRQDYSDTGSRRTRRYAERTYIQELAECA